MQEAYIVQAKRTAIGKAVKGSLAQVRPDDLGAYVIQDILKNVPALKTEEIDDCVIGCSFPEAEQGMNMARIMAMRAGLPLDVTGVTINRFCSSGLQAISMAADRIRLGEADVMIGGGAESMSMVPMVGNKPAPNPFMLANAPEVYISMGITAENVAKKYEVTREQQDAFAVQSHQKAFAAQSRGRFDDEIVSIPLPTWGKPGEKWFNKDEGIRPETTMESLAKLRPAFLNGGSVTAGNSSQTSDGAAITLLMSEQKVKALGLKPIAVWRGFAVAGVEPELMGIGPIKAIPKVLKQVGLTLDQIDLFELNEAFASQSLAIIKTLDIDPAKVNPNGGAIAFGHPLGCTGAKLTATLLHELTKQKKKYGMVTMCIGGGMGAAGVYELL
ncbi:acetyl-CoA C-acyltransferase [Desulfosporosinus sp. BICA1-9]|uniref:acetyl-CoA C-acyltransferase n=1 Tax=Desulfosporosinus sp. BICA1-9 TaxID=1531958 RepID=UPI00054C34F7|nr:acetyl-CoA C-acyltransferase [Desulfosporosinus sp. BICA1-9]KJS49163.1 MAG: acetyl-CoA acetyltransferase [Peptococcaceae bacterium BRH_c23]KJS90666.1 MAG: acetyl-CoA acetyltransferase [Desulfosporosinus sp. BICA1-9]HBW34949.1 acetyl-CoA C-acyltransferase [Desulfosporosinus sp.]